MFRKPLGAVEFDDSQTFFPSARLDNTRDIRTGRAQSEWRTNPGQLGESDDRAAVAHEIHGLNQRGWVVNRSFADCA